MNYPKSCFFFGARSALDADIKAVGPPETYCQIPKRRELRALQVFSSRAYGSKGFE